MVLETISKKQVSTIRKVLGRKVMRSEFLVNSDKSNLLSVQNFSFPTYKFQNLNLRGPFQPLWFMVVNHTCFLEELLLFF